MGKRWKVRFFSRCFGCRSKALLLVQTNLKRAMSSLRKNYWKFK